MLLTHLDSGEKIKNKFTIGIQNSLKNCEFVKERFSSEMYECNYVKNCKIVKRISLR
jgi:hypothetical protein